MTVDAPPQNRSPQGGGTGTAAAVDRALCPELPHWILSWSCRRVTDQNMASEGLGLRTTVFHGGGDHVGTRDVWLLGPCFQGCGSSGARASLCPQPRLTPLSSSSQVPELKEEGSTHLAVPGVCFICPLTGALLRKDQRDSHIKEAIASVSGGPRPPSPLEVLGQ